MGGAQSNVCLMGAAMAGHRTTRSPRTKGLNFLLERYQALTSLLPAAKPRKARKRKEANE